jgi:hypothetical protein
MSAIELFACKPLDVKLTRKACGDRHRRQARKVNTLGGNEFAELRGFECKGCEIGKAHAAGESPAVELVQIRRVS